MDGRPVAPMCTTGNMQENWRWWKIRFSTFLAATESTKKPEATKCAMLLHMIGESGLRIYQTFKLSDAEQNKYNVLIDRFEKHFAPQKNLVLERHLFLTLRAARGTENQLLTTLILENFGQEFVGKYYL